MSTIEQSIDVHVPVRTAYDQWTQFEQFPRFMEGVEDVRQLDDTHTHWVTKVAGRTKAFDAVVTEQRPDERIAWSSQDGPEHAGVVTFHRLGDGETRVMLQMDYEPEGPAEKVGDLWASSSTASRATSSASRSSSRPQGAAGAPGAARSTRPRRAEPGGPACRPRDPAMRLGFAVKVLGGGGLPSHDARRWQSGPGLDVSLDALEAVLAYCDDRDIRMYRMATGLAPYASHPDLPQFRDAARPPRRAPGRGRGSRPAPRDPALLAPRPVHRPELRGRRGPAPGRRRARGPGRAHGRDGPRARGRRRAPRRRRGGRHRGGAGPLRARRRAALRRGPRPARPRERRPHLRPARRARAQRRIGRPVVWDILHHHCHDPDRIPDREALELALATWPAGVRPKVHYSTPKTAMEEVKRAGRAPRRAPAGPPPAPRPRRPHRPDRLRGASRCGPPAGSSST